MPSSHAPTNPLAPPKKAAPNLTSPPPPSSATDAPAPSSATAAPPPPPMPLTTPSTTAAPPAPVIKFRFRPLYGPPPPPPTHESAPPAPPSTFTFINTTPRSLRAISSPTAPAVSHPTSAPTPAIRAPGPSHHQSSTSGPPTTIWTPINLQQAPPSAPPTTTTTTSAPLPTTITTTSAPAPRAPSKRPRHAWTPAELTILTCLRLHTPLSYDTIATHMSTLLRAPRLNPELLRYKANQLRGVMPPSQAQRRSRPGRVNARWRYFAALTARAVEVQRVLRGCGMRELWAGQAAEDGLAVLVLYGEMGDGEVARRMTERFGVECSEEMVGFWKGVSVGRREGSWAWFEGKGAGDQEVRAVLREFGL